MNQLLKDSHVQSARWQLLLFPRVMTFPTNPAEAQKRFHLEGQSILPEKKGIMKTELISNSTEARNFLATHFI